MQALGSNILCRQMDARWKTLNLGEEAVWAPWERRESRTSHDGAIIEEIVIPDEPVVYDLEDPGIPLEDPGVPFAVVVKPDPDASSTLEHNKPEEALKDVDDGVGPAQPPTSVDFPMSEAECEEMDKEIQKFDQILCYDPGLTPDTVTLEYLDGSWYRWEVNKALQDLSDDGGDDDDGHGDWLETDDEDCWKQLESDDEMGSSDKILDWMGKFAKWRRKTRWIDHSRRLSMLGHSVREGSVHLSTEYFTAVRILLWERFTKGGGTENFAVLAKAVALDGLYFIQNISQLLIRVWGYFAPRIRRSPDRQIITSSAVLESVEIFCSSDVPYEYPVGRYDLSKYRGRRVELYGRSPFPPFHMIDRWQFWRKQHDIESDNDDDDDDDDDELFSPGDDASSSSSGSSSSSSSGSSQPRSDFSYDSLYFNDYFDEHPREERSRPRVPFRFDIDTATPEIFTPAFVDRLLEIQWSENFFCLERFARTRRASYVYGILIERWLKFCADLRCPSFHRRLVVLARKAVTIPRLAATLSSQSNDPLLDFVATRAPSNVVSYLLLFL